MAKNLLVDLLRTLPAFQEAEAWERRRVMRKKMHGTSVKLKDGRELTGPIWEWRPQEGFFTLVDEEGVNEGNPIEVRFADVISAVNYGIRVSVTRTKNVDLLARARAEGWTG